MNLNKALIKYLAFPVMERFKGNKIRQYLSHLKHTQFLPPDEIKRLQQKKLAVLLRHCLARVPAYQPFAYLLDQLEREPEGVLKQLPILTKQNFIENTNLYLAQGQKPENLILNRTGGSTGEPVRFYLDRATVEHYEAARWRGLSWWGIEIGDPSAMIWGSPLELSQNQQLLYYLKERYLKNRIIIPAYGMKPEGLAEYVKKINSLRPVYIYGYASALALFARLASESGIKLKLRLKGVVSTAETLHEHMRAEIESFFNCKAVNEYGARDGGIIAYECPCGGMHISAENLYLEIVDLKTKKPVETGKTGLVLVTDLNNFAMPRLRYQLGDLAALSPERCPCGVNLPLMGNIEGREDDVFVGRNGKFIHGHFFNHIARNLDGIRQFQLVQSAPRAVILKIVKGKNFAEQEVEFFKNKILEALGEVDITLEFVPAIPPSPSGKVQYAKRLFPIS